MTNARSRILLLAAVMLAASSVATAQQDMGEAFVYTNDGGTGMPYRLLAPPGAGQADREFPLIVFLHGAGERGTDNNIQMRVHIDGLRAATQTEEYGSFLIAPQLPPGNTFWHPDLSYDLTMEIIDTVKQQYPIDESRIYVTGLSLGGNGSFSYIAEFPETFAAAVPMSGWGDESTASTIRDVPQWIFHGTSDSVVSVSRSRDMFNAVDRLGGGSLYTEIYRGPHGIWAPIYSDWQTDEHGLYPWLFRQQIPTEPTVQLISSDSTWRYLDDGSDPGTTWHMTDFDDQAWLEGKGQFGYGDRDETTVTNCGPSAPACGSDNFATTFFRQRFQIADRSLIEGPAIELLRDDAAAVYVNGVEVFRDSTLPDDATFETYAGSTENLHVGIPLVAELLHQGVNVVAVEVHQASATNRDLSFDLRLTAKQVPEPGMFLPIWAAGVCIWLSRRTNRRRVKTAPTSPLPHRAW